MYNSKIIEILKNPKNAGIIKGANAVGKASSDVCCDILRFYLVVDNGIVTEAKFKTFGGSVLIASASVATSLLIGRTVDEVSEFDTNEIIAVLGALPNKKSYCLRLLSQALKNAVEDYYKNLAKE